MEQEAEATAVQPARLRELQGAVKDLLRSGLIGVEQSSAIGNQLGTMVEVAEQPPTPEPVKPDVLLKRAERKLAKLRHRAKQLEQRAAEAQAALAAAESEQNSADEMLAQVRKDIHKLEVDKRPWAAAVHGLPDPSSQQHVPTKEEPRATQGDAEEHPMETMWRYLATDATDEGIELRRRTERLYERRQQEEKDQAEAERPAGNQAASAGEVAVEAAAAAAPLQVPASFEAAASAAGAGESRHGRGTGSKGDGGAGKGKGGSRSRGQEPEPARKRSRSRKREEARDEEEDFEDEDYWAAAMESGHFADRGLL